jgi:hypothetical protein
MMTFYASCHVLEQSAVLEAFLDFGKSRVLHTLMALERRLKPCPESAM